MRLFGQKVSFIIRKVSGEAMENSIIRMKDLFGRGVGGKGVQGGLIPVIVGKENRWFSIVINTNDEGSFL